MTYETWENFFIELSTGSGKWFGLFGVTALVLLLCWKKKEASFIFIPFTIIYGLQFIGEIAPTEPFFIAVVVFMFLPVFIAFDYLRGNH